MNMGAADVGSTTPESQLCCEEEEPQEEQEEGCLVETVDLSPGESDVEEGIS